MSQPPEEGFWAPLEDADVRFFQKVNRHKRQNRRTAAYLRETGQEQDQRVAERLELCGRHMGYKECGQGHRKGWMVWRCEKRGLCPICDGQRARENGRRLGVYADLLQESKAGKRAGYRWRHLSLPVRTDGDIPGAVQTAWDAFSKLWRNRLGGKDKNAPVGAVASMEISPTGNVHLHVGYYGPSIRQEDLSLWWLQYTGGSFVVVITDKGTSWDRVESEVLKYASKPAETPTETLVAFWRALYRKARVQPYGTMRKDVLARATGLSAEQIDARVEAAEEGRKACPECGDKHTVFVLDPTLDDFAKAFGVGLHAHAWHPSVGHIDRGPP